MEDNIPKRSKRLGRGLSALIPEINEEVDKKEIIQIMLIKVQEVVEERRIINKEVLN